MLYGCTGAVQKASIPILTMCSCLKPVHAEPTGARLAELVPNPTQQDNNTHHSDVVWEPITHTWTQPAAVTRVEAQTMAAVVPEPAFQTPAQSRGVPYQVTKLVPVSDPVKTPAHPAVVLVSDPVTETPAHPTGVPSPPERGTQAWERVPGTAEALAGVASFVHSLTPATHVSLCMRFRVS